MIRSFADAARHRDVPQYEILHLKRLAIGERMTFRQNFIHRFNGSTVLKEGKYTKKT